MRHYLFNLPLRIGLGVGAKVNDFITYIAKSIDPIAFSYRLSTLRTQ